MVPLNQHRHIGPLLPLTVCLPWDEAHDCEACLTIWLDGTKLAYFRGRKLQGKVVKLPENYRGVVVERIPELDSKTAPEEPLEEDIDAEEEQVGSMKVTSEFDEMVVWGHETVADACADPYVRSMEEWLQVADKVCMHCIEMSILYTDITYKIHSYSLPGDVAQK